ncbi:MAG: valine--tRNA ligase [Steroidobacteraceae bacterium]
MDKTFSPGSIESTIYERWESRGWFAPRGSGDPYVIMLPPPNVTGTLHMGHAFQHTLMDALTRYHRMSGRNTLWQPGTDHAGIATQMVVERQLATAGRNRRDMPREDFLAEVWRWKAQSGGTIVAQMRRLGASVDWTRERFTMDPDLSRAVNEAFVRLYEDGLIYRGKRLVNWDPVLLTALSDLEVLSTEEDGKLWHLRYPLEGAEGHVTVATTRPETMLGDAAVAVNPDDPRYAHLVGKRVRLPIAERSIPIIADHYVDPEFGSGCVKITPAHDFNDFEIGERHGLPMLNILTADAHLNDSVPERYRGLDRYAARQQLIAEFESLGLLEHTEAHKLMVPRGDRSGAVLEPLLTDQWYVRIDSLAQEALSAVESGRTRFVPENWTKTYYEWMRNIRDWCISRQLWWGHRIPAWYDNEGRCYVGRDEAEVRSKHALADSLALRQDPDVLDTWFSSALWPFSTLGWPDESTDLRSFYPGSVLVTGFDIIFFWVARMMMMGLKFRKDVPFREVYITGLVRDEHGQKMSKSKGNIIDPIDVVDGIDLDALIAKRTSGLMQEHLRPAIEKATRKEYPQGIAAHGADALRFTFAALATQGRDIRFDLGRVGGYRNFCNKIWNAARFVMMTVGDQPPVRPAAGTESVVDRWAQSRFSAMLADVHAAFAEYRFDYAANALYTFVWHEYCDWYLELCKPILQGEDPDAAARVRYNMVSLLEAAMRALHPLMPFITEEIWLKLAPLAGAHHESVMLADYPLTQNHARDLQAESEISWIQQFVMGLRQIRGEMDVSPGRRLSIKIADASVDDRRLLAAHESLLRRLAALGSIDVLPADAPAPPAAMANVGLMRLLVPLAGLIEPAAERDRLQKRMQKLQKDLDRSRGLLAKDSFVNGAPAAVVQQERDRVTEFEALLGKLRGQAAIVDRLIDGN